MESCHRTGRDAAPPRRSSAGLGSLVSGVDLALDSQRLPGQASIFSSRFHTHSATDEGEHDPSAPQSFSRPARHAFGSHAPLNATMVLAMVGCGVDSAPATPVNLFDEAAGTVATRRLAFDTLWVYGGAGDTIMLNADRVAAFPGGDAAVLDLLGRRVHRVGVGGVAWSWGTRGEGPGEIDHVRDLDVNAEEEVVLVDSGNGKLHWLSADGTWAPRGWAAGGHNQRGCGRVAGGRSVHSFSSLMYATALAALESTPPGPIAANRWVRVSAEGEIEGARAVSLGRLSLDVLFSDGRQHRGCPVPVLKRRLPVGVRVWVGQRLLRLQRQRGRGVPVCAPCRLPGG